MPNDVTASEMQIFQVELGRVFKNRGTVNPSLSNTPVTLPTVLSNQTADVMPLMAGAGEACVGVEVYYPLADNVTAPTVSATPIAGACDLTTGDGVSSAKQTYDLNVFLKENVKLNDNDCDNLLKFMPKKALAIATKMALYAKSLNDRMITLLETNKSVTVATNLPSAVTIPGTEYTIVGDDYWEGIGASKIIPVLDQLAFSRGLAGNYYIISGKALSIPVILARDASRNQNEVSYTYTFGRRDIYNDVKNLDTLVGAEVIYLVDPNAIFGYFYNSYTEQPFETKDKNNTINYSLPLYYFDDYQTGNLNQSVLSFMSNGVAQPVMVDIREQKTCNASGKYGDVSHDFVWEIGLKGILNVVPKLDTTLTGIIRVDRA